MLELWAGMGSHDAQSVDRAEEHNLFIYRILPKNSRKKMKLEAKGYYKQTEIAY